MTVTPYTVADALPLLGLRIYAPVHLLILTYTVGSVSIKPSISPKRLKIERKLLLTAVYWLSIATKICMTLNDDDPWRDSR